MRTAHVAARAIAPYVASGASQYTKPGRVRNQNPLQRNEESPFVKDTEYWRTTGVTFVAYFVTGFNYYCYSLIGAILQQGLGWSQSMAFLGFVPYNVSSAIMSPVIGRMLPRVEPKRLMCLGAFIVGCGFISLAYVNSPMRLIVSMCLVGIGGVAAGMVTSAYVLSSLRQAIGLAMGIAITGMSFGGLIGVPLLERACAALGWRTALVGTGGVLWAICIPIFAIGVPIMHFANSSKGVLAHEASAVGTPRSSDASPVERKSKWRSMRGAPLLVAFAFIPIASGQSIVVTHEVSYLVTTGLQISLAVKALGLTAGFGAAGKAIVGLISDRFDARKILLMCFAGQFIGVLLLISVRNSLTLWLFIAVYGLMLGAIQPLNALVVMRVFSKDVFPFVYGSLLSVSTFIAAGGPLLAGFLYDQTGSYMVPFGFVLCLIAAAMFSLSLLIMRGIGEIPGVHSSSVG